MSNQGRSNEVDGAVELPPWWDDATMKLVDYEEALVLEAMEVKVYHDAQRGGEGAVYRIS